MAFENLEDEIWRGSSDSERDDQEDDLKEATDRFRLDSKDHLFKIPKYFWVHSNKMFPD